MGCAGKGWGSLFVIGYTQILANLASFFSDLAVNIINIKLQVITI
jgi:hypothetical protein